MPVPNDIYEKALKLNPLQKAQLIDKLISSLDRPSSEIDELWAGEAENRIAAYESGKLKSVGAFETKLD